MATVTMLMILVALVFVLLNMETTMDSVMEAIIISRQNSSRSPGRLPQYTPNNQSVSRIIARH
ncbi:hypothetical protein D3C81_2270840 [compost metagenome]